MFACMSVSASFRVCTIAYAFFGLVSVRAHVFSAYLCEFYCTRLRFAVLLTLVQRSHSPRLLPALKNVALVANHFSLLY